MHTSTDTSRPQSHRLRRDGALTILALLLSFAAFDDITTGNETDFTTEYVAALACSVWLLVLSIRLMRRGHYVLACASLLALAGAFWAQSAIQPGITPGFWPEHIVVAGAFLWFAMLAFQLLVFGWREAYPFRGYRSDRDGKNGIRT
jgi:hypothetical protein